MTGEIHEMYLSELHSHTTSEDQMSFSEFTGEEDDQYGTKIAVVTDPTGGIVEAADEFIPELGMPEEELNLFRSTRAELNMDDGVERHNRAAEEVNLSQRYSDYINKDSIAQEKIEGLAERVLDGENITLVCFEKEPKWCHRHVLKEHIEEKVEEMSEG